MDNLNFDIAERLGTLVRENRIKQGLTQSQLAENICSQAMISSIERGIDIPNVVMFTEICNRLRITKTDQFLANSINMHSFQSFSHEIFELCKNHQYREMLEKMDKSSVLEQLITDQDIQTYYYYYSCALYQLHINTKDAIRYLKLSAHFSMAQPYIPNTEIEILLTNALASLYLEIGYYDQASTLFKTVYKQFMECSDNSENLNVVLYHYGEYLYYMKDYAEALVIFLQGFDDVVAKQSYFMLAEYSLNIARCYMKLGKEEQSAYYHNQHQVLSNIVLNRSHDH